MKQMGLIVGATAGAFETWLAAHTSSAEATGYPVVRGVARFGPLDRLPVAPEAPLRWAIGGVIFGDDGYGYPLVQPLGVEVTPIGCGDRLAVVIHCRRPEAQAYMVALVLAASRQWPECGQTIWASEPPTGRLLGQLKLKSSVADLALGLQDFAAAYQADGVTRVSVVENRAPAASPRLPIAGPASRRRAWAIHLHLPGPELMSCHIRHLTLNLEAVRMPGRYPVMFTLTPQGHPFPEVAAFAEAFLAWCRETYRTAPITGSSVPARPGTTAAVMGRAAPKPLDPTDQPWELIPDHLWDRRALKLWWEGLTCPEIGERLSQAPKTIRNRLTLLRQAYGLEIVPLNRRRERVGTLG